VTERATIEIRPLAESDLAGFAALYREMERFYGDPAPDAAAVVGRVRALPAGIEILLALDHGRPVGLAAFSLAFPGAPLQLTFYLKELFVSAAESRRGVGARLLQELARIAVARDCERMDWTTARDNTAARSLYEAIGAEYRATTVHYRLEGAALAALAETAQAKRRL